MHRAQVAFLVQPKVFFSVVGFGISFVLNHMPSRKSPKSLSALVNLSQTLSRGLKTTYQDGTEHLSQTGEEIRSGQVFSLLISVEHSGTPGIPTEHGQALGCSFGEDVSSLLLCSGRCCHNLTPSSPRAVGTQAGPAEQCDFSPSVGTYQFITRGELCFIQKSWGIQSEEEGGHGLMFLLHGHLQARGWEMHDWFECI